jgi:hypothetical protein
MFEKGLFLFIGVIALANFFLFILSIYYSTNLFNTSYEKFLEFQGLY